MKVETKIRDFSLRLIYIIVWFVILWAVVFLIGLVFQWSGLTDQLAAAFYGSGFCAILLLVALAILNITANLNLVSKAQLAKATAGPVAETPSGYFTRTIVFAAILIGIVVLSIWFAERRLYQSKAADTMRKMESIAETKLAKETIRLIRDDAKITELDKARDALSANIQSKTSLSIIFPEKVNGVVIYRELNYWWGSNDNDIKISEAGLPKFVPNSAERKKFERLIAGEITEFTIPHDSNIRAFLMAQTPDGKMILLVDTSRRSEYSRSSF